MGVEWFGGVISRNAATIATLGAAERNTCAS